jgi:hypothetical protein
MEDTATERRGYMTASGPTKCSREESNLHGFPHTVLSRTRLPFRHVSERPVKCASVPTAQPQMTDDGSRAAGIL